jgi:DNA ligase-1
MKELFKASTSIGVRGLDGEAIPGDPYNHNAMQACTSAFNCNFREAPFGFFVFDSYQYADQPFSERLKYATEAAHKLRDMGWKDDAPVNIQPVEHVLVTNQEELFAYYDGIIARGLEGVMGRHPDAPYKYGRSTMRESWLWALKPYVDSEAEIIGFEEMLENQNEQTVNERGYSSRQGLKENMVPKGMLGKFVCRDEVNFPGKVFKVGMGVGLTHALRQYVWDHKEEFLGEFIKYKYQAVGVLDLPRQPKYMGFRDKRDMARFAA